jgi:hypothetical protein
MTKVIKQRVTAFIDPTLVTRAKVRGALEGLTISEVVEKALEVYAPLIEKQDHHISLKFVHDSSIKALIPKKTKHLIIPRE